MQLQAEGWEEDPVISLREAAQLLNPKNEFHSSSCNCKSGCSSKCCICRQKGATCSSKCHGGKSCKNQPLSPSSLGDEPNKKRQKSAIILSDEDSDKEDNRNKQPPRKRRKQLPRHTANTGGQQPPKKSVIISSDEDSDQELKEDTTWVPELHLDQMDKQQLDSGSWLTDNHISAAQTLLKDQFPHIDGLQPPTLSETGEWSVLLSEGVQILNDPSKKTLDMCVDSWVPHQCHQSLW